MLCGSCRTDKPSEEFYRNKSRKSGLDHLCKECRRSVSRDHFAAKKAAADPLVGGDMGKFFNWG